MGRLGDLEDYVVDWMKECGTIKGKQKEIGKEVGKLEKTAVKERSYFDTRLRTPKPQTK